jgi:hypothetical protein
MKTKSKTPTTDHSQAMAEFDKLPEKTKRLLELKQQAGRATGKSADETQKEIRKHSRAE